MSVDKSELRAFADLPPVAVVPDTTLQLFCDMATLIIDEDFAGSSLSVNRLGMIELNLAAHFAIVSLEKGGLTQQIVGQSAERYQLMSDKNSGLGASRFGQQALALDTTGVLSQYASSPVKAQFEVI